MLADPKLDENRKSARHRVLKGGIIEHQRECLR